MTKIKTVLIVDDDDEIRDLLVDYFKTKEFYSYSAHDIDSAMEVARTHKIDVVILDDNLFAGTRGVYHIPGFQNYNKQCKIYMLTANSNPRLKEKAALLGASGFLVKPVDFDTLDKALNPGLFGKEVWE